MPVSFFEATTGRGQVGGIHECGGVFPKDRRLDQRLEQGLIDLSQSPHARMGAKRIKEAHVGRALAMAQLCKGTPGALFRQQMREQIERMHRSQHRQQMRAPELGRAELPTRAAHGPCVPVGVDEVVGNERVELFEQLAGAGDREVGS